ncbi:MAG: response regulator [Dehalococcoidia bacterium]|nr:response regulator [Dehalococcoidia bacterium]
MVGAATNTVHYTMTSRRRILLIDPNDVARAGCRAILESDNRFEIVAVEANVDAGLEKVGNDVDVVVLDPLLNGKVEEDEYLLQRILAAFPSAAIILHTDSIDLLSYIKALTVGVRGLLLKAQTPGWLLIEAVRMVTDSNAVIIDRSVLLRMRLAGASWEVRHSAITLSRRELEVAQALSEGMSDDEVSHALGVARATVHTHVASIMRKVPASNRVQLGIYLLKAGLVDGLPRGADEQRLRVAS